MFSTSPPKLHQNPGETLHIRRLENGLKRPYGRSRPTPWRFASLDGTDAFAGALPRGSIRTFPASEETTNTQRFEADSLAGGPGFEPRLTESESAVPPLNYPRPVEGEVRSDGRIRGEARPMSNWALCLILLKEHRR
jgi:hypothetical protein